jgi:hypothetical protein
MAARIDDLQGSLLRHRPKVVHFSGHGSESGEIVFEDRNGTSSPVSSRALRSLFSTLRDDVKCVVLNACGTKDQASAIATEVECVVGMSRDIQDVSAIAFATAFYQALAYGKDVKSAFDSGCTQIDLKNLGEQETPKLISLRIDPASLSFA